MYICFLYQSFLVPICKYDNQHKVTLKNDNLFLHFVFLRDFESNDDVNRNIRLGC